MLPDLMNPGEAIKKLMAPIMEDGAVDDSGIQSLVDIGMDGIDTLAGILDQSEATKPVRATPCLPGSPYALMTVPSALCDCA